MEFALIYLNIAILFIGFMDLRMSIYKSTLTWYWLPIILVASTWIISYPLCRHIIYRQGKSKDG